MFNKFILRLPLLPSILPLLFSFPSSILLPLSLSPPFSFLSFHFFSLFHPIFSTLPFFTPFFLNSLYLPFPHPAYLTCLPTLSPSSLPPLISPASPPLHSCPFSPLSPPAPFLAKFPPPFLIPLAKIPIPPFMST